MSSAKLTMSWNDRFALIDHFTPNDDTICQVFNLTKDELDTARSLRSSGTFQPTTGMDVAKYTGIFSASVAGAVAPTQPTKPAAVKVPTAKPTTAPAAKPTTKPTTTKTAPATVHAKPETASKKAKEPQKRGRKGDKIAKALQAVPTSKVPVESFIKEHGISLAVLRQSKRFIAALDPATQQAIGKVNVRQDSASKQLMIWREEPSKAELAGATATA